MASNTKLHELLAVEGNLDTQATKTKADLVKTFTDKRHLFSETRKTFQSIEENKPPVTEEQSDIQTSVGAEIKWISAVLAKALDASHQIDVANTSAKGDIIVEDETTPILTGVPATSLLQLETSLKGVRELIVAIPTLDPAKGFTPDTTKGAGTFKARDVVKTRTTKVMKPVVLYAATDKHPAQVEKVIEDVPVGTLLEQQWSSLINPATKAELLDRVDKLIRAVKRARSRANDQTFDVSGMKIGKTLLDYIFKPLGVA